MREIRITFRGEDFAAISEKLIGLGVTFHVEPLGGEDGGASGRPPASPRASATKKKATKKLSIERTFQPASGTSEAAARLRAMAERNRAAGVRPANDPEEANPPSEPEN